MLDSPSLSLSFSPFHHSPRRIIANTPKSTHRHHHTRQPLDQENPRPSRQPTHPAHLSNTPSQHPTKGPRDRGAREYDGHPQPALVAPVPLRHVEVCARKEAAFEETEKGAGGEQGRVGGYEALADGADGPEEHG